MDKSRIYIEGDGLFFIAYIHFPCTACGKYLCSELKESGREAPCASCGALVLIPSRKDARESARIARTEESDCRRQSRREQAELEQRKRELLRARKLEQLTLLEREASGSEQMGQVSLAAKSPDPFGCIQPEITPHTPVIPGPDRDNYTLFQKVSESRPMNELDGWFIHMLSSDGDRKGPYETVTMEDYASQGIIVPETRISHLRHTKGRIVEARRIARLFNIFAKVTVGTELSLHNGGKQIAPVSLGQTERNEEVHGIGRFMADGQDPAMICKLTERVDGICTRDENALYMAVQQRPVVNFSPDAVVLTNRRAIIFRQKVLGRLQFVDLQWLDVADVHLGEDILGSTISIRGLNGHIEQVTYLPKAQARKIYRIAQDMEEKMVELRRERSMEEKKAGAMTVTVNNDLGSMFQPVASNQSLDDPLTALKSLRAMLDAELISTDEYEAKKRQIMERL